MSESRSHGARLDQETNMVSREKEKQGSDYQAMLEKVAKIKREAEVYLADPVVRTGAEASLRTGINAMISVADCFPGVGSLASWGADAAKVWARVKYTQEREKVRKAGGDPDTVKLSPVDLTPDVDVSVAVLTEMLELISADLLPTHVIESALQLRHDWVKIRDGYKRAREITAQRAEITDNEAEAASTFAVKMPERLVIDVTPE